MAGWGDRTGRIDHTSPVPLWQQVRDDLAADIASGELPVGSRLLSIDDLTEVYGVSRPTVRHAVRVLAEDGLLTIVTGKGTYVTKHG